MGIISRARYRVWQYWNLVHPAPLTETDEEEIASVLSPGEIDLLHSQSLAGQRHGLRVMRQLKSKGYEDVDLLAAALLHDAGKAKQHMAWWERPVVVLVEAFSPRTAERLAAGPGTGLSRPFVAKAMHAEWGAEAASAAGSSRVTVELIRRHQDSITGSEELTGGQEDTDSNRDIDSLLSLLQWADGLN